MANDIIKGFKINERGYGIIPKSVMQDTNLNIGAKAVYAYFCSFTGAGNNCFPTRDKICSDLGVSKDTLSKYLKNLVESGYLIVEQAKENGKFSHNIYTLPSEIMPPNEITDTEITVSEKTVPDNSVSDELDTKINNIKINNIKNNNIIKKENSKEKKKTENIADMVREHGARKALQCNKNVTQEIDKELAFEEFWKEYPKKQGKKDAQKAFSKLKLNKELFEKIMQAIKTQKNNSDWVKENGKYIPLPATWIRGERWEDEIIQTFTNSQIAENYLSALYQQETQAENNNLIGDKHYD